MKKKHAEMHEYDANDTTDWIDRTHPLSVTDLGLQLPPTPPSQVVSLRLPTALLNRLRAHASADDIPYQVLIKMILAKYLRRHSHA